MHVGFFVIFLLPNACHSLNEYGLNVQNSKTKTKGNLSNYQGRTMQTDFVPTQLMPFIIINENTSQLSPENNI